MVTKYTYYFYVISILIKTLYIIIYITLIYVYYIGNYKFCKKCNLPYNHGRWVLNNYINLNDIYFILIANVYYLLYVKSLVVIILKVIGLLPHRVILNENDNYLHTCCYFLTISTELQTIGNFVLLSPLKHEVIPTRWYWW